jgi:hypothetical protein
MPKDDRRDQLLVVMHAVYKRAKTQAEFTPLIIAEEADLSVVWVYQLIGKEIKELRAKLKKTPSRSKRIEAKLREENRDLRHRLRESEKRYEAEIQTDYGGAIKHIEAQDEEIRVLRGRVKLLEERLRASQVLVEISTSETSKDVEQSDPELDPNRDSHKIIDSVNDFSN